MLRKPKKEKEREKPMNRRKRKKRGNRDFLNFHNIKSNN